MSGCITHGPFRSAKAFVDFIQNSEWVHEQVLIECLRAYPVPVGVTDETLLDLIRCTRKDLKHYGF